MILVSDKTQQKTYYFPKEKNSGDAATLKLFSHLSKSEFSFDVSGSTTLDLYYALSPDFSGVYDGEYDYSIYDANGIVLQNGLLRIGEYDAGDIIYDFKEEYIVYNPETGESEIIEYGDCTDAVNDAYRSGFQSGNTVGFENGYASGLTQGFPTGYESGRTDGINIGYGSGYTEGYQEGYVEGDADGFAIGYQSGFSAGYVSGYTDGSSSGSPIPTSGFEGMYFTIQPLYDGTISWDAPNLQYRLNDGSWTNWDGEIDVTRRDTVAFKGTNATYSGYTIQSNFAYDVYGNSMSLLYGDNFENQTELVSGYTFYYLFYQGLVADASNLILPATTLTEGCYEYMFYGCYGLTEVPELPATQLAPYCYNNMFSNCTNLTEAPELPATELAPYCYSSMFSDCSSLTTPPELPATTLADYCYSSMFIRCRALLTPPELPATTLAPYCYSSMFSTCTSLVEAPELPATTLATGCYYMMFSECTSLTNAPELPATTLANGCYNSMFRRCTSLVEAPELPATEVLDSCYRYMFSGCTSLTTAPELPATTLVPYCYSYMFQGCSNLNYIKCLATYRPAYASNSWVFGVASAGTFVKAAEMEGWTIGADGIPEGWIIENEGSGDTTYLIMSASSYNLAAEDDELSWSYSANTEWKLTVESPWGGGETYISAGSGSPVYAIGQNDTLSARTFTYIGENLDTEVTLTFTQAASAYTPTPTSGYASMPFTIQMLEDGDIRWRGNGSDTLYQINGGERQVLNGNITGLSAGDEVQFTVSADTIVSYNTNHIYSAAKHNVLGNIMSLCYVDFESATTIPTTGLFGWLFSGDINLISAENLILPATTLTNSCYDKLFDGCSNLTTAPELPATTLAEYCYYRMFKNCSNLSYIKCLAETIPYVTCVSDWVNGVAANGTFVKSANMNDWGTGNSGIPDGWTVIDE